MRVSGWLMYNGLSKSLFHSLGGLLERSRGEWRHRTVRQKTLPLKNRVASKRMKTQRCSSYMYCSMITHVHVHVHTYRHMYM